MFFAIRVRLVVLYRYFVKKSSSVIHILANLKLVTFYQALNYIYLICDLQLKRIIIMSLTTRFEPRPHDTIVCHLHKTKTNCLSIFILSCFSYLVIRYFNVIFGLFTEILTTCRPLAG